MQFTPLADQFGFLYLYPDGTQEPDGDRFWNATDACCDFDGTGVDDSGYLRDLIDEIKLQLNVDPRRVYVMGHSNGGFMSYRMACDHSETIAAIMSLAGATFYDPANCTPAVPVHVLQIHGTADATILYDGGFILGNPYPGAVETVEIWAAYNGCSLIPDTTHPNLDLTSIPGDETEVTRYIDDCDPGGSAELWSIVGGEHAPILSDEFGPLVIEHLLSHPKDGFSVVMTLTGPDKYFAAADEVVTYTGEILNLGPADDGYDITVRNVPGGWSYSYTTPAGTFSGPSTLLLASGETASFELAIDSQGHPGPASVIFQANSQNESLNAAAVKLRKLNGLQVLLVDDDGGENRETYVESSLDAAGVSWDIWHLIDGELTATDLQNAGQSVFWMCGNTTSSSLTPNDRAALGAYMDGGGKAFLSGSYIAAHLCDPGSPYYTPESLQWFENYLHATYVTGYQACFTVDGTPGDPIGDGIGGMVISDSGDNFQGPDGVLPGSDADLVFTCTPSEEGHAGVRWQGATQATQVVFFGFGVEGIDEDADRNLVVGRIIDWFEITTGISGPWEAAPVVLLAQNVPNPFNPITTIRFELSVPTSVSLGIYDVSGRLVQVLIGGRTVEAGPNERVWNGRDATGRMAAAGVYFYRLEAGDFVETKKMVLLK